MMLNINCINTCVFPRYILLYAFILLFYINGVVLLSHYLYDFCGVLLCSFPVLKISQHYTHLPERNLKLHDFDKIYWRVFNWIIDNRVAFFSDNLNVGIKLKEVHMQRYVRDLSFYSLNYEDFFCSYLKDLTSMYDNNVPYPYYELENLNPYTSWSDYMLHKVSGMHAARCRLHDGCLNASGIVGKLRYYTDKLVSYLDDRLHFNAFEREVVFFIISSLISPHGLTDVFDKVSMSWIDVNNLSKEWLLSIFSAGNYHLFYRTLEERLRSSILEDHVVCKSYLESTYTTLYKYVGSLGVLDTNTKVLNMLSHSLPFPNFGTPRMGSPYVMSDCWYQLAWSPYVRTCYICYSYRIDINSHELERLNVPHPNTVELHSLTYLLEGLSWYYHNRFLPKLDIIYDKLVECCDAFDAHKARLDVHDANLVKIHPNLSLYRTEPFVVAEDMLLFKARECLSALEEVILFNDGNLKLLDSYLGNLVETTDGDIFDLNNPPTRINHGNIKGGHQGGLLFQLLLTNSDCRSYMKKRDLASLTNYVDGGQLDIDLSRYYYRHVRRQLGWYGYPL